MAERPSRRRSAMLALLVVAGAAATASAAALTWWTQTHVDTLAGAVTTRATGSQTDPLLVPLSLVALAGFGAALATAGVLRRGVGALLVLGGGWTLVLALAGAVRSPASLHTDLTRPAVSSGPTRLHAVGPLLGAVGGLLVLLAGVLLLVGFGARAGARRALGTRYDAPTGRRRPPPAAISQDPADDPDAAAGWWKALDAGQDPTGSADPGVSGDVSRGV